MPYDPDTTTHKLKIGDRIELLPHLDLWMMGARYGTIVRFYSTGRIGVKLDKLGHERMFWSGDFRVI